MEVHSRNVTHGCSGSPSFATRSERTALPARRQRPPLTVRPSWSDGSSPVSQAVLADPPQLSLELDDPKGVLAWVDDPGRPGELEFGNSVIGLQPRKVIVLDVDPAGTELPDL